jgi:drug/metabolite transporter (DMT)-like permease
LIKKYSGKIGLFIVAIIWGTGFAASALALDNYTPYQTLALRFSMAFVLSLLIYRKKIKNISKEVAIKSSMIGIFLFLAFLFQTVGLQYTTASKNAFLTAVNIIIVPFIGLVIYREKIPTKSLIGSVVTLMGIAFLSVDGSGLGGVNKGDLLTLVAALFFALQIFYTDYNVKNIDPGAIMIIQMGTAALLSWITVLFTGQTDVNLTFTALKPIFYLGIVSTMVAYGIQTWAQRITNSTEAAVILSTEAFFGMIASILILGELVTIQILFGAVLIFVGILIVELS